MSETDRLKELIRERNQIIKRMERDLVTLRKAQSIQNKLIVEFKLMLKPEDQELFMQKRRDLIATAGYQMQFDISGAMDGTPRTAAISGC